MLLSVCFRCFGTGSVLRQHNVYIQMVGEWAEVEDSQRAERSQRSHFSPLELTVNKLGNFPHKKEEVEL